MVGFKKGDRVVYKENGMWEGKYLFNKTGTVLHNDSVIVSVEWDEYISGHRGHSNIGKDGYCWNVPVTYLKLLIQSKPGKIIKGELIALFKTTIRVEEEYDD